MYTGTVPLASMGRWLGASYCTIAIFGLVLLVQEIQVQTRRNLAQRKDVGGGGGGVRGVFTCIVHTLQRRNKHS